MDLVKVIRKVQRKKAERERTHTEAYCLLCRTRVSLTTIEQAKQLYTSNWDEILRLAENGEVHLIHNSEGELLVCSNSLEQIEFHLQDTQLLKPRLVRN